MKRLLPIVLCCLLPLPVTSCVGTKPEVRATATTVVTLGTLSEGARMAQQNSSGRAWSVELNGGHLTLTVNGVPAVFRGAAIEGQVTYRFEQASSTWAFYLDGGEVYWRGDEVRVGNTTHDLSKPGNYAFTAEDWGAAE